MIWHAPELEKMADNNNPIVGYSVVFKTFQKALKKRGIEIERNNSRDKQFNFIPPIWWEKLVQNYPCKTRVVLSMWEATQIKPEWAKIANEHFDLLVVPNKFNKDIFHNGGVKIPILVQPLGINPDYMTILDRKIKDDFYFLHYNSGEHRKGWYVLTDAFLEEFGSDENVKLIVKNSGVRESVMNRTLSTQPELNRKVVAIRQKYTTSQMLEMAKKAHCFVFPAIGEGYGYTPREMLATGMPTIISEGHSFDELPDWYIKVKSEIKEGLSGYLPNLEKSFAYRPLISDTYKGSSFWYADKNDLKKKMRDVYNNWPLYYAEARKNAKKVWKAENIDNLITPLVDSLQEYAQ